ncbi:MAG: XisI protein [Bacteroidia bacterium]
MEKVARYQKLIRELLEEWAEVRESEENVENQVIVDTIQNHFQLVRVGWVGDKYIFSPMIHFDIKNDKIWLQANFTDADVARELVDKGVPRQDIVLGFQPPYVRPHTEYGVA